MAAATEFAILGITLLHDTFNLSRYELVVILAIIFEDSLDKFEALPQRLIFNI